MTILAYIITGLFILAGLWFILKALRVVTLLLKLALRFRRDVKMIRLGKKHGIEADPFPEYDGYHPRWERTSDYYRGVGGDSPFAGIPKFHDDDGGPF